MESMVNVINILFIVIILGGVIMTIVGLPGNFLLVLSALAYGYYDGFENVDYAILVIVFGVYIFSEVVEFVAGILGAKKEKASKRAVLAAFAGTLLGGIWGTAILPLIGSFLGALLGAFVISALAEYTKTKNVEQAKRVAISVVKGNIFAMIVKFTTAVGIAIILIYQLKWH